MSTQKLWTKPFAIIMVANFLMFLSVNMLSPTLPLYFQDIGFNKTMTGICTSMFTLGSLLVRPIAGGVLDRYGRRIVFYFSVLILTTLVFGYNMTTAFMALVALRLIHGFDWSFASTATNTMATDIIPRHMIGRGMGIFALSTAVALAFAPTIAISVMNRFGFDKMVLTSAIFLMISMTLVLFFPFAPIEKKTDHKRLTKEDMFERTAVLPAVITVFISLTLSAILSYVPLYAVTLNIANVGLFFTTYAFGLFAVRSFVGNIIDKYGIMHAIVPALLSMVVALLLIAFAQNFYMLLLGGLLYGLGYGGSQTPMHSLAVMNVTRERYGAANGTYYIGVDLGVAAGALLAGVLSDLVGFRMMYLLLICSILTSLTLVAIYRPHKPVEEK